MLRLSSLQTSSIELTLKDMTASPQIGLLLNCVLDIISPDFNSVYDEDTSIFLRLHYYDNSKSDIKCIHSVSGENIMLKLTSDNSLIYLNFDKLINNISLVSDTLLLNINLFEKYSKQEFLIKQPKLNLLDFVALTAATSGDNKELLKMISDKERETASEIQKVRFNNQQIGEHLDKALEQKISSVLTQTDNDISQFKKEILAQSRSQNNLIEQILEENELHKKEVAEIMEKAQVQVLDIVADKIDTFEVTEIITKLKKQIADLEAKLKNDDEITTVIASFEKIQQSLLAKNNNELKEQVVALVNQRLNEDINLMALEGMQNYIASKSYFHIGKIDIISEKEKGGDKKKYAWIKILTNIDFPKVTSIPDKPSKPFIMENQNTLLDLFQLSVKGTKVLPFLSGVFLAKGPKSPLDFPIGHKKYEWLEAELHLQFDITDLPTDQKVDFIYQSFPIADTIICNYDNIDWRHYYINNINSFLPKKTSSSESRTQFESRTQTVTQSQSQSAPQSLFS